MLHNLNSDERDFRISFNEKDHTYLIDNILPCVSVTTIINSFHEKFNADLILEKMRKKIDNDPANKYYGKTNEEIKKEWNLSGKIASELGTKMHYQIECFYNGDLNSINEDMIEIKYHFKNFHEEYVQKHNLTAYRTEWRIFDEDAEIAGTIDMVYIDEFNDLHIFDWKRTKSLEKVNNYANMFCPLHHLPDCNFWHYSLQLNIYRYILIKKYNRSIKSLNLVILHEINNNYIVEEVPILEKEVEIIFNMIKMNKQKKINCL